MKKHLTGNTIFFLFALAAILFCSCTPGVSGVETTNGFTITATTTAIKGTAPAYSTVYLFDTGYIPYIDSGFGYGTAVNADENALQTAAVSISQNLSIHVENSSATSFANGHLFVNISNVQTSDVLSLNIDGTGITNPSEGLEVWNVNANSPVMIDGRKTLDIQPFIRAGFLIRTIGQSSYAFISTTNNSL